MSTKHSVCSSVTSCQSTDKLYQNFFKSTPLSVNACSMSITHYINFVVCTVYEPEDTKATKSKNKPHVSWDTATSGGQQPNKRWIFQGVEIWYCTRELINWGVDLSQCWYPDSRCRCIAVLIYRFEVLVYCGVDRSRC